MLFSEGISIFLGLSLTMSISFNIYHCVKLSKIEKKINDLISYIKFKKKSKIYPIKRKNNTILKVKNKKGKIYNEFRDDDDDEDEDNKKITRNYVSIEHELRDINNLRKKRLELITETENKINSIFNKNIKNSDDNCNEIIENQNNSINDLEIKKENLDTEIENLDIKTKKEEKVIDTFSEKIEIKHEDNDDNQKINEDTKDKIIIINNKEVNNYNKQNKKYSINPLKWFK